MNAQPLKIFAGRIHRVKIMKEVIFANVTMVINNPIMAMKSAKTSTNVLMAPINVRPQQLVRILMVATLVHVQMALKEMVLMLE